MHRSRKEQEQESEEVGGEGGGLMTDFNNEKRGAPSHR